MCVISLGRERVKDGLPLFLGGYMFRVIFLEEMRTNALK